jgi:selenocysteine lyase/cysteine desulfurase
MAAEREDFWDRARESVIGRNAWIATPFGRRRVTYADYTASGRGIAFIEGYVRRLLELYANTHTEDDATGRITTGRLHQAERTIKRLLHAGPEYRIIEDGTGATGAVHRLQQILGIYLPPVAKDFFRTLLARRFAGGELDAFSAFVLAHRPVVFVGPYEHHSNEVSWRECYAEVVEVELDADGLLDLADLSQKLSRPEYRDRRKIGAFSAASNVSGVVTPVYEVARILHRHDALAFFDFAASAPCAAIDVCRDGESFFDGVYFSPHKFLGGPGSSGILIIHERIYRRDLPPTVGAGGTVDYVSFDEQAYSSDIEAREKPGTPGILQIMRAALALELKERLGVERIAARERELIRRAMERFAACQPIEIVGNRDPDRRIAIFSFNIRAGASYLHPRFTTALLSDLFGIQSRAGCSCAGPYGHRVLHIDRETSRVYRERLACGLGGLKPGWTRINFHFLITDEEADFLLDAVCFVCRWGKYFLPLYHFDIHTGAWRHRDFAPPETRFGLEEALEEEVPAADDRRPARELYRGYLEEALRLAESLKRDFREENLQTTERDLIPFVYM